jgi:hypothetical protein
LNPATFTNAVLWVISHDVERRVGLLPLADGVDLTLEHVRIQISEIRNENFHWVKPFKVKT